MLLLQKELPNKADKKDLENFKIPDDLMQRLSDMKMQVDNMMTLRNRVSFDSLPQSYASSTPFSPSLTKHNTLINGNRKLT